MSSLNAISLFGIFGLCLIAWVFSENRSMRVFPWRTAIAGILLQLVLGAFVFVVPGTRDALKAFSDLLNAVFDAADFGARFVFGVNIVPRPDKPPDVNLGYIFAFRALPTVVFFSGLMALLYNIGVIQAVTNVFAKIFYVVMRLSGAEALSGAANIFVGIEAAIVVKPYLPKMTRSELCAILACCFGTAASSTLAIYVSFLKPVFPNILGHLVSASIMAIPACFVLSKILVPETGVPLTAGGIPVEDNPRKRKSRKTNGDGMGPAAEGMAAGASEAATLMQEEGNGEVAELPELSEAEAELEVPQETVGGEPIERVSPLDAAIVGALDGVKMAVAIAAVLIIILGLVSLINQLFAGLASLKSFNPAENANFLAQAFAPVLRSVGEFFNVVTLANIMGVVFFPLTILTGVSDNMDEIWRASVIIGRRLLETAIPPYQALAEASKNGLLSDRAVVIVSYALSGFAHLASVGIFVGGTIALIPSRRKDISELGWKALFVGTLATLMIACVSGVFFNPGDASILGDKQAPAPQVSPSPSSSPSASPSPSVSPSPSSSPAASPSPTTPPASPTPTPQATGASPKPSPSAPVKQSPQAAPKAPPTPKQGATQPPAKPVPATR